MSRPLIFVVFPPLIMCRQVSTRPLSATIVLTASGILVPARLFVVASTLVLLRSFDGHRLLFSLSVVAVRVRVLPTTTGPGRFNYSQLRLVSYVVGPVVSSWCWSILVVLLWCSMVLAVYR